MFDDVLDRAEEYDDRTNVGYVDDDQVKAQQYDDIELPDEVRDHLQDEVERSYEEGMERAGFLRYEDDEITGVIPYDWLEERGMVEERGERSFRFTDALDEAVQTLNDDETRLIGYHTHPRDNPGSDSRDREVIKEQNAPEIVVLEDRGRYRARLLGLPDEETVETDGVSYEAVETYTQGLEHIELEL
jgi:hypothetical protein